jgi:branched-chain amino acid transport system substrate-binding protein
MSQDKRKSPPPIVFIIALGLIGFGVFKFLPGLFASKSSDTSTPTPGSTPTAGASPSGAIATRISLGNQILVISQTTPDKQAGVDAFGKGDYSAAMQSFQASLQKNRNDPETVIYLNNAAARSNPSLLKIAVSVPIGSNPNVAQEILRGVAQAQSEVNKSGGINGAKLQVEIVNDDNDPGVVKEVANTLTKDASILAIIGHNASNASLEAAPIYQQQKLVMVTPTSFANDLSGFGSYIFRTVPNISIMAAPLAEYAVKTGKTNIAICYDSKAPDNISFRDEFVAALTAAKGTIVPTVCDFSLPSFNPDTAIADAVSKGAQGLMLAPHIDRIDRAIFLARTNQGKLPLYGSTTMYTFQTLKDGQKSVDGLVLPVPWHPETNPGSTFPKNASQRWGGVVNWRTATSYDAAQAVIAGLQQSNTREGLQQALKSPNFSTPGASEDVKFLPSGDRAGSPILVQIKAVGKTGYNFSLLR